MSYSDGDGPYSASEIDAKDLRFRALTPTSAIAADCSLARTARRLPAKAPAAQPAPLQGDPRTRAWLPHPPPLLRKRCRPRLLVAVSLGIVVVEGVHEHPAMLAPTTPRRMRRLGGMGTGRNGPRTPSVGLVSVAIDVEELLGAVGQDEAAPLPFAVRAFDPAAEPTELLSAVQAAIDSANRAALLRIPSDPTWCTEGDLAGVEVRAELAKGLFSEAEVREWFADFARVLGAGPLDALVAPEVVDARVPNLDDWITMPPAVTAFFRFTAEVDGRVRRVPERVITQTADQLVAWSTLPNATTVIERGLTSVVVNNRAAATEMRRSAALDPQHGVAQILTSQRQARIIRFTTKARASAQVVDTNCPPAEDAG